MLQGQGTDRDSTRRNNAKAMLTLLLAEQSAPRNFLAEKTGISVMTVGRIADDLIEAGFLLETKNAAQREPGAGRPPKVLRLNADQLLCCGANLDQKALHLGIVDPYGKLRDRSDISCPPNVVRNPDRLLPWLAEELKRFTRPWSGKGLLNKIGLTLPGIVNVNDGILQFSANLGISDCHVREYLEQCLPEFCVHLENDAKALALAEYRFGAAAGTQNLVILSMGAGVGSAAILNGEIYRSRNNMAGEIGHIVLNPAGKICECGKTGCLQTNLTTKAILSEAHNVYPGIGLAELMQYAEHGEAYAQALVKQVVGAMSMAINLLANTYAPEAIILCGDTIWSCPGFIPLVLKDYKKLISEYMLDTFEVRPDSFGPDGYVIGGGAVAFSHVTDELRLQYL